MKARISQGGRASGRRREKLQGQGRASRCRKHQRNHRAPAAFFLAAFRLVERSLLEPTMVAVCGRAAWLSFANRARGIGDGAIVGRSCMTPFLGFSVLELVMYPEPAMQFEPQRWSLELDLRYQATFNRIAGDRRGRSMARLSHGCRFRGNRVSGK
jgi:hypothetical protein